MAIRKLVNLRKEVALSFTHSRVVFPGKKLIDSIATEKPIDVDDAEETDEVNFLPDLVYQVRLRVKALIAASILITREELCKVMYAQVDFESTLK